MTSSLVGSEMCIRDRKYACTRWRLPPSELLLSASLPWPTSAPLPMSSPCLLYTSDAADDM
eukprot:9289388-Prorocentrum_lima.AAC.1